MTTTPGSPRSPLRLRRLLLPLLAVALAALSQVPLGWGEPEELGGVRNFGRVTDLFFRGGKVTRAGLERLYDLGVRTVIDLTGKREEEAAARELGMKFHSFPMKGSERPDDASVERILQILREAKEPVYAHCAAGKHRVGTIAALYRIRVQGWSPEKAWQEQEAYGFGPPSGHPELYAYVYGRAGPAAESESTSTGSDTQERKVHKDDGGD